MLDYNSDKNTSYSYLTKKQFMNQSNPGCKINNTKYIRVKQSQPPQLFQYCTLEIGSTILWYSKKIFFNSLYFILKCSDPRKLQYIYSGRLTKKLKSYKPHRVIKFILFRY